MKKIFIFLTFSCLFLILLGVFYNLTNQKNPKDVKKILFLIPHVHRENSLILSEFEKEFAKNNNNNNVILEVYNTKGRPFSEILKQHQYDLVITIGQDACRDVASAPSSLCIAVTTPPENQFSLVIDNSLVSLKAYLSMFSTKQPVGYVTQKTSKEHFQEKNLGHRVEPIFIVNTKDLELIKNQLHHNIGGLIVAREDLLMQDILPLIKLAQIRNIPIGTMDEGSVYEGASFAIAPSARLIGSKAASTAKGILSGMINQQNPYVRIFEKEIFVNKALQASQRGNLNEIQSYASHHHIPLKFVNTFIR